MLQTVQSTEKKIGFIFHHGWGYDNSYWKNIILMFCDFPYIIYNAGYFEDVSIKQYECISDISWIGIGHSIGFIKLLEKNRGHEISLSAIIGLQSFVNFLGFDNQLNKNRSIILERMISAFKKSPLQVLREFRKNSGFSELNLEKINPDLLLQDLEMLKVSFSIPDHLNTLIVAGENDPIVDRVLITDNFLSDKKLKNCKVEFINCNRHTLGYDNPQIVYDCIMNFIKNVIW